MRLDDAPESGNVEDRRGMSPGLMVGGVGGVILAILGLIFGVNPQRLGVGGGGGGRPPADNYKQFAGKVLGTLEEVWTAEFRDPKNRYGMPYQPAHMVLFSQSVRTGGCGVAPSEVGPFYCPADKTIYLDPTFFQELAGKLGGSKGEFSQAYVIAHENGHHVQNLLGYSDRVDAERRRGKQAANRASVRLELQADYLAGVWAYHGQKKFNFIQPGDVESAITSAKAIGDDRLQKESRGWASPESYTHGTSRQRVAAFSAGLRTGDATKGRLERFFEVDISPQGELTPEPW